MLTLEERHLILFTKDGYKTDSNRLSDHQNNPLVRIRPIAARHYDLTLDQASDAQVMSMVLGLYETLYKHEIITLPYHVLLRAYVIDLAHYPDVSPNLLLINRMLNEIRYIERDRYDDSFTLPQPDHGIINDIENLSEPIRTGD